LREVRLLYDLQRPAADAAHDLWTRFLAKYESKPVSINSDGPRVDARHMRMLCGVARGEQGTRRRAGWLVRRVVEEREGLQQRMRAHAR
jgi:hypothetical protein